MLRHTYLAFGCGLLAGLVLFGVAVALYQSPAETNEQYLWIAALFALLNPLVTGIGGYAMDRALAREREHAATAASINDAHERMKGEYQEYLDVTPGVILRSRLDQSGRLLVEWANRSGLGLFNITMEQARGRDIFDFVHEKDRGAVEAHARGIIGEMIQTSLEFNARTADGRDLTVVSRSVPIKEGGLVVGLHTMISDLTEIRSKDAALRDERSRLERMQRISHTGSWEIDLDTGVVTGSVNAFHIYGLPTNPDFRLTLETIRSVNLEPERAAVALHDLVHHGRAYDLVFDINRHGERRIIHSIAELVRRDDGSPWKVVGSIQDITERVRLERQLAAAQKDRILNTLAAGIAHDFNNILAAILGNLELVESESELERKKHHRIENERELLQEIRRATLRGKEMTRALLSFARSEPDQNKRALDLSELVAEVAGLLGRSIGKAIVIDTKLGADLFTIDGIASELHQVLMNLCVNASEAMPSGGSLKIGVNKVKIDLASCVGHPILRPGHYLELTIRDTGVGITPDVLDKIFEPFFTTKKNAQPGLRSGTGLGLATVRNIVERHNGTIGVASTPGLGTTFTILLPKGSLKREASVPIAASQPACTAGTVLVIDDEAPVRIMLKRMLGTLGFRVFCAEDGEEGLALFSGNPEIGIVLLDSSMPKLNGEETFLRLRSIRQCKIVLSSGNLEPAKRARLLSLGLNGVLEKPYDRETLLHCLRSLD